MAEPSSEPPQRHIFVAREQQGFIVTDGGADTALTAESFTRWVAEQESTRPRWVWGDTAEIYPALLRAGVRVDRAHDLRLCRTILQLAVPDETWADPVWGAPTVDQDVSALFTWSDAPITRPQGLDEVAAEWRHQQRVLARTQDPGRMRLLLAAESAGGLIAAEMHHSGVPWSRAIHEQILTDTLGERRGGVPARMTELATAVRRELGDPTVNLDSQQKLLKALRQAGINATSTSRWELREHDHPAIAPLIEYRKLSRLLTANGWAWLDDWVHDGRFRPVYVPGGVVTGRWASSGGGALQIPRLLRPAVHADPGWRIVSADVAQLEPRVLAAMSRDERMAEAAAGQDLYEGIVASGAVAERHEAKIAVLGAMYGATTGDAGRLVPRLRKVFPRAMHLVDEAARIGEEGGTVRTWLGRTSPAPSERWFGVQAGASRSADAERVARRWARDQGRFTRNFVVQGTAAEWALAWMAELRLALRRAQGPDRPELVFFLHDEVLIHAPEELAGECAMLLQEAADAAGRLLFGAFPIDFRLDVHVASDAAK
ncbi:MAG: bifunctional 3'-5' exonuclease/DNA polymerase [Microbacterium sp.]